MPCFLLPAKHSKKIAIPWEPVPSTKNQRKHQHSEINKMGHILKNLGRIRLHHRRIYVEIFCLICLITNFNFAMDGHGLFGQFTRFLRFNRVPLNIPPSIFWTNARWMYGHMYFCVCSKRRSIGRISGSKQSRDVFRVLKISWPFPDWTWWRLRVM